MLGSFINRILILALGYAYPAYECYKTVEKNKPEIELLRFWCQYWILVALLTVFERVGDILISWLPMYNETKLAFLVYLWFPKTRGTTYVYENLLQPYIAQHETEIDRNLLELRTRAGDSAVIFFKKVATYGQTSFYEILQYVALQSNSIRSRSAQQQPQRQRQEEVVYKPPPIVRTRQTVLEQEQPPRPTPSTFKNLDREPTAQEAGAAPAHDKASSGPSSPNAENCSEAEAMQVEVTDVSKTEDSSMDPNETIMEEAIRMTRVRLRKATSSITAASAH